MMEPSGSPKPFCDPVEYFTIDKNHKLLYGGYCNVYLNAFLQELHVVPISTVGTVIAASFTWNFAMEANIVFVESPSDVSNFALVFDNLILPRKLFYIVPMIANISAVAQLEKFKRKFFLPFMDELNNPKEAEVLSKFLGFCCSQRKNVFMSMMMNHQASSLIDEQEVDEVPTVIPTIKRSSRKQSLVPRKRRFSKHKASNDPSSSEQSDEPIILKVVTKKARSSESQSPSPSSDHPKSTQTFNFKVIEVKIKDRTKQKLFVFANEERTRCHTFVKEDDETIFKCMDCRIRKKNIGNAEIKKNDEEKEYVEVTPGDHACRSREYAPGRRANRTIIKKPGYEILDAYVKFSLRQRLIIFDKENRELCYEYFPHRNAFQCGGCVKQRKDTRAQIYHNGIEGKEYVELYNFDHVCELRPYNPVKLSKPQAILKKPEYLIKEIIQGGREIKRLYVFVDDEQKLCYEYVFRAFGFACKECLTKQQTTSANIIMDNENNECIRLGINEHICDPIPFINDTEKEDIIIESGDFEMITEENQSLRLIIYDKINSNLNYQFLQSNDCLYYCIKCKAKRHYLIIKLLQKDNGEYYIKMSAEVNHVCEPYTGPLTTYLKPRIVKSPNFIFYLNDEGKQRLAVFIDDERTLCYTYYLNSTDQHKKFLCGGCSTFARRPSAKVWKNDQDEVYIELGICEHVCIPKEYEVLKKSIVKILKLTDVVKPRVKNVTAIRNFELKPDKRSNKDAILRIFTSETKKLYYEFKFQKFNNKYRCCECEKLRTRVTAKISHDDDGKKYIEMGNNDHLCTPLKAKKQPPKFKNFLFFDNEAERRGDKLLIFTDASRKKFYEFSLWKGQKYFHCLGCYPMKSVIAKMLKDENNEDYVEFGRIEHVCSPKDFELEKYGNYMILSEDQYEVFPNFKGEPTSKLIIFNPENSSLGYDFVTDKFFSCLKCRSLKRNIVARFINMKEKSEKVLEVSKSEHLCEMQNFLDVGKIYYESDFSFDIDLEEGNQTITTICPENRNSWYKFAYDDGLQCYFCIQCKKEKNRITAAKIKKIEGRNQFLILAYSHCCTPLSV